jgi:hypothetical protein
VHEFDTRMPQGQRPNSWKKKETGEDANLQTMHNMGAYAIPHHFHLPQFELWIHISFAWLVVVLANDALVCLLDVILLSIGKCASVVPVSYFQGELGLDRGGYGFGQMYLIELSEIMMLPFFGVVDGRECSVLGGSNVKPGQDLL